MQDITENPAYESTSKAVSSVTEEDKEKELEGDTYEVLPCEASEENQTDTTQNNQEGLADDLYDYADQ